MAITQEQIDALELSVYEAGLSGTNSVTVDGTTVSMADALSRLKFLKEYKSISVNSVAASQSHFGLRPVKFIPPGCG